METPNGEIDRTAGLRVFTSFTEPSLPRVRRLVESVRRVWAKISQPDRDALAASWRKGFHPGMLVSFDPVQPPVATPNYLVIPTQAIDKDDAALDAAVASAFSKCRRGSGICGILDRRNAADIAVEWSGGQSAAAAFAEKVIGWGLA